MEYKLHETRKCLFFLLPVHVTCSALRKEASDKHVFLLWLVWVSTENVTTVSMTFWTPFALLCPSQVQKGEKKKKKTKAERDVGNSYSLVWICKTPASGCQPGEAIWFLDSDDSEVCSSWERGLLSTWAVALLDCCVTATSSFCDMPVVLQNPSTPLLSGMESQLVLLCF